MRFGRAPLTTTSRASLTVNQSGPPDDNADSNGLGVIGGDSYRNSDQKKKPHQSGTEGTIRVIRAKSFRRAHGRITAIGFGLIVLATIFSCTQDSGVDPSAESANADHARRRVDADIDPDSALASGLIGSKHDFSQSPIRSQDLCTPCHVPHIAPGRAPLLDKRPAARGRYRPYDATSSDLDATSMLCLSCHDGVIASDVFTSAHGTQWARQTTGSPFGGGGATGHPIGVLYPIFASSTYQTEASVVADGAIKLPGGRVQCISCHDPHNTGRHDGMLVKSNAGSRLCLSCHRL